MASTTAVPDSFGIWMGVYEVFAEISWTLYLGLYGLMRAGRACNASYNSASTGELYHAFNGVTEVR